MARKIATNIDASGPFFTYDPAKTFRRNAQRLLDETAEHGSTLVRSEMVAGQSRRSPIRIVSPNRVAAHVIAQVRVRQSDPDKLVSVVKVRNGGMSPRQAISLMAAASEIEGQSHPFRRVAGRLRKANKVNAAELLKDIA